MQGAGTGTAGRAPGRPSSTGTTVGAGWHAHAAARQPRARRARRPRPARAAGAGAPARPCSRAARGRGPRARASGADRSLVVAVRRRAATATAPRGPEFARARGYDLALSEVQRELALPVDDDLLAGLADDAARAHAAYTLRSWSGPVPDDLLQGWAELTSILATEAPTGDLELEPEAVSTDAVREREAQRRSRGRGARSTTPSRCPTSGEVVAYSDLATTVHEPGRAYQWGTLVRRDAPRPPARRRGQGRQPAAAAARAPRHHPADDLQRRGQQPHDRRQRGARLPAGRPARGLPEEAG